MTGVEWIDKSKTPGLVGWAERLCSDNVVKDVLPEARRSLHNIRSQGER